MDNELKNSPTEWRHPLAWDWLDEKIGVGPGWGATLLFAAFGVLAQWTLILLQLFCMPCIQSMFEAIGL